MTHPTRVPASAPVWTGSAVAAGCVAACALAAAVIANPKLTLAAVLALGFAVFAIACLRRAALLAIAVAPFTNILGSWLGFGAGPVGGALRDAAVLAIVLLWSAGVIRERRRLPLSAGRVLVIGFAGVVCILALATDDWVTAAYGARNLAFYTCLLFLAADLFPPGEHQRRAVRAVLVALSLLALVGILEVVTNGAALTKIGFDLSYSAQGITRQETVDTFLGHRRATAGVGNALDFSWLMMFGFLMALAWRPDRPWERRLRRATLATTACGAILSLTRSAWLGIGGGLIVMAVLARSRRAWFALTATAVCVAVLLMTFPELVYLDRLLSRDVASQSTTSQRLLIYDYAQRFAPANPVGIGIGSQGSANRRVVDPRRFTLDSYYLQLIGEGGVLLLSVYLAAAAALFIELWKRARSRSTAAPTAAGALGVLSGALLANVTSGSMDSRIVSIEFWFLIGLALAEPSSLRPAAPPFAASNPRPDAT